MKPGSPLPGSTIADLGGSRSAALVDGRVSTSVSFTEPGAFVIRAAADDGSFVSSTDVTVTVETMDPDLAR